LDDIKKALEAEKEKLTTKTIPDLKVALSNLCDDI
jgi:hypothetical protein